MKHIKYSYLQTVRDCKRIAKICKENYNIKYVYGPPRGGCILAVILSHKLDAKYLISLKQKHIPENTLVCDDVSDSGKTLNKICKNKKYVTATVYIKPQTIYVPDIFCHSTQNNIWIDYWWEEKS